MDRREVVKRIIDIIITEDVITEAEELAYQNDITLSEIWEDDDIIGMAVDDEVIYF